jgi:telomere length regulation protein
MAVDLEDAQAPVREIISRLRLPVPDVSTLLALLAGPLDRLNLLPPKFRQYNTSPIPHGALVSAKHIPTLQQAILEHVVPTWRDVLADEGVTLLLDQYFCPDAFSFASPAAGEVTSLAYSSILALPLTAYSVHLLARLTREYPIDRLYAAVFTKTGAQGGPRRSIAWEDCISSVVAVPAKVANALGGKADVPDVLEHATYFNNLSLRCEALVYSLSQGTKGVSQSSNYPRCNLFSMC